MDTKHDTSCLRSVVEDQKYQSISFSRCCQLSNQQYEAVHLCKLVGHEGSIFRIAWSSCGSKLVSVSDDRRCVIFLFFDCSCDVLVVMIYAVFHSSARVWAVPIKREELSGHDPVALVLFGHSARVWDCSIFNSVSLSVLRTFSISIVYVLLLLLFGYYTCFVACL